MALKTISPEKLELLKEVRSPILRQRFSVYYRLPDDLQQWMFAEEAAIKIYSTAHEKHGLSEDQTHKIARAVGLIFLGEVPVKDFIRKLIDEAGLDQQKAAGVAKDINQEIFQPVKESLMEVHGLSQDSKQEPYSESSESSAPKKEQPTEKKALATPAKEPDVMQKTKLPNQNAEVKEKSYEGSVKPISLEELEAIESKPKENTTKPIQKNVATEDAKKAREGLIEKLRQERGEKEAAENALDKGGTEVPGQDEEPRAQTTSIDYSPKQEAWNGRTIDLSKIPPRRKSPKKDRVKVKIHEA